MGFFRREDWNGLSFPAPRDLPDPGIEPKPPTAPALQAVSLPLSHKGSQDARINVPYQSFEWIQIRNLPFYSCLVKQVAWKFHKFFSESEIHTFSKIYTLYTLFIYMYTEAFLLHLIKAWERTTKMRNT